jgi:DNA-binding response OmpR family regulator
MSASWSPGRQGSVRVLIAEDDDGLRSVLQRGLEEGGYAVDAVKDGDLALRFLTTYEYEVAILDWRMPKVSGLEVVQRLRRRGSALPILMLTARDTARDRVAGLDEGADDYLIKPFDFSELLARVRALQRRGEAVQSRVIKVAALALDSVTREVSVGSTRPRLTATELSLLEILMQRSPAVVSRRSIALAVWDEEADALGSNTLDVHLARLRAKITGSGAKIEAVRALGYRMVPA